MKSHLSLLLLVVSLRWYHCLFNLIIFIDNDQCNLLIVDTTLLSLSFSQPSSLYSTLLFWLLFYDITFVLLMRLMLFGIIHCLLFPFYLLFYCRYLLCIIVVDMHWLWSYYVPVLFLTILLWWLILRANGRVTVTTEASEAVKWQCIEAWLEVGVMTYCGNLSSPPFSLLFYSDTKCSDDISDLVALY